jgi:hypothetical protein
MMIDDTNSSEDHGSRDQLASRLSAEALAEQKKQEFKDQSYLRAIRKAEESSHKLLEVAASTSFDDEDDTELQASLERQRRAKLRAKDQNSVEVITFECHCIYEEWTSFSR